MGRTLALMLVVGLSVPIAEADEKPTPPPKLSTVTPENDWRLAKQTGAQLQKIGVLTYYPNTGGGYTFMKGKDIVFYALPFLPTTHNLQHNLLNGTIMVQVGAVGTVPMPFGGQTVYRSEMTDTGFGRSRRDIPRAIWSRDAPDRDFRLSIKHGDHDTRLILEYIARHKSTIPR
jgi:hypothetical protein